MTQVRRTFYLTFSKCGADKVIKTVTNCDNSPFYDAEFCFKLVIQKRYRLQKIKTILTAPTLTVLHRLQTRWRYDIFPP